MKEIYINADDYNSDSIKTIQGNNNAEEYKIYLQYDNEKIDLTGKTVNLAFLRVGSTDGDIIENLNVTNPKEGEITLKITNKISKRNGTYSCQLAILGEGDFLEHTATFTLTVENNIFSDITKAIADSKDFTYLERILEEASKLSEKLKENTASATNANSNLESNITEANNINSKLLENTSTATSLNKNLESNIDLAKEVKETIKDLDTKNIEATSKIERLEGLNAKAEELSNNINEALPVKDALVKNTEEAKVANTNLVENISILETKLDIAKETVQNLEPINEKIDNISKEVDEKIDDVNISRDKTWSSEKIEKFVRENNVYKSKLLVNYTHDSNKLIVPINLNLETGVYTTKEPHGLETGENLLPSYFIKDSYPIGLVAEIPYEIWTFDFTTWYFLQVEKIDEFNFKLKSNKDNKFLIYDKEKNNSLKCGNWGFEVPTGEITLSNANLSVYKKIKIIIRSKTLCQGYSTDCFKKIFNNQVKLNIINSCELPYVSQPYDNVVTSNLAEQKYKYECISTTLEINENKVVQETQRSILGFRKHLHYNHPQLTNASFNDYYNLSSEVIEGVDFLDNPVLFSLNYKYLNGTTIEIYGEELK